MAPVLNRLLEKRVPFCSSLKALSTDTSFIKIGVCQQKLSTLEFNFYYRLSSHWGHLTKWNTISSSRLHALVC